MSETGAASAVPSKRKRARRACEPCRKRKKKCDGKEPCQLCQEYEYVCTYAPEDPLVGQPLPKGQLQAINAGFSSPLPGRQSLAHNHEEDGTVFDARKGFLVDASSVLAFPRLLASSLESGQPPKLRNLVYNLGIRQERYFLQGTTLSQIVSLDDAQQYSLAFFRIVHPWHAYLDQAEYMARLDRHYTEMLHDPPFEMMIAFVVALGSYFSWPDRFSKEEELVDHAIRWMDRSVFPDVNAQICIYYVGSWIARAIYQRGTGSPSTAWISSCIAMHLVESMGLHREWDTIKTISHNTTETLSASQIDCRRRIYWCAFTVNRLISTEYGRSSVEVVGANCKLFELKPGETFQLLVDTARILPHAVNPNDESAQDYLEAIGKLARPPQDGDPVYIALVRGDVACLLYRRLSLMNVRLTDDIAKHILSLGQKGTEAACALAVERQPWWKVISTPFQFLCVLLSLDTCDSLKLVPEVLRALLQISDIFDTQRTKEAYETARLLVQIAQQKKEKELSCLREGLAVTSTDPSIIMSEAWVDMDIDWMELMDPDLFSMESIV